MTSSRFAAGSGARFVGVRLRLPLRVCLRSGLPSGLPVCLERVAGTFSATAAPFSGAPSESASCAVAETGFFLPLPPRLPRRRLFFGPAGELCSSAGSVSRLLYEQSVRPYFLFRSCALLRGVLFLLLAKAKPA